MAFTDDHPFGIGDFIAWNHSWNRFHYSPESVRKAVDLIAQSGARWFRLEMILWDFQSESQVDTLKKYDAIIDLFQKKGISLLALLINSPTHSDSSWNLSPDIKTFLNSVSTVVDRYKDRISHWEIWNEPDNELFWIPQDKMRAYSELLRQSYHHIKSLDSSAVVHAAGLSKSLPAALRQIYDHAGPRSFDVVHIHPFVNPNGPHALEALQALYSTVRNVMKDYNDLEKEIWFSETGCPGIKNVNETAPWWLGANVDEQTQAKWVTTIYENCLQWPGVKKIFWGQFRDSDGFFRNGVDRFGLIRNDFSLKPAYHSYQKLVLNHMRKSLEKHSAI